MKDQTYQWPEARGARQLDNTYGCFGADSGTFCACCALRAQQAGNVRVRPLAPASIGGASFVATQDCSRRSRPWMMPSARHGQHFARLASHHEDIRAGEREAGREGRELGSSGRAGAIGIIEQRPGSAVVDDPVGRIPGRRADPEGVRHKHALHQRREDEVVENQSVVRHREIRDAVDPGDRQRGLEAELILAAATGQHVRAGIAGQEIVTGTARKRVVAAASGQGVVPVVS